MNDEPVAPKQPTQLPRSLKEKITADEELASQTTNNEQKATTYEGLIRDILVVIREERNKKLLEDALAIMAEFKAAHFEHAIEYTSTDGFHRTVILNLENDETTEIEVFAETIETARAKMEDLAWQRLYEKRWTQYTRLKGLVSHRFPLDQIIHDPIARKDDILGK